MTRPGDAGARKRELLEAVLRKQGTAPPALPIPRRPDPSAPAPLGPEQERLWAVEQVSPGTAVYNEPYLADLAFPVDVPVLRRALDRLVARHEILRVRVFPLEGRPVQQVSPRARAVLGVADLRGLPERARAAAAEAARQAEARRPFDLAAEAPFRALLVRLGPDRHELVLNLHHAVCDGPSVVVLARELSALYGVAERGAAARLSPLPVQYPDYATWWRTAREPEVLARDLPYWEERLAGAPTVLDLPTDRPRPAVRRTEGARVTVLLPEPLAGRLAAAARRERTSLFTTLLAGFGVLLGRWTGQSDLLVGTVSQTRTRAELEGVVGFFVNTLALRLDLDGDPAGTELLGRVRRTVLEAFRHQELPFSTLVERLRPERSAGHAPLVQALFVLQPRPGRIEGEGPSFGLAPIDNGTSKLDLAVVVRPVAGGLACSVDYSRALFDRTTVRRLVRGLERVWEGLAADPGAPVRSLGLPGPAERQQLLEWSDPPPWPAASAPDLPAHRLFAEQAARTPDRVALAAEEGRWSYGHLAARARGLARTLGARRLPPEARVGLLLERSPELVAGMLGVLEAGGAFVPLDLSYPPARLRYLIEDAGLDLVVTRRDVAAGPVADGILDRDRVLCLDDGPGESVDGTHAPAPASAPDPERLAYVIYTSGSTGTPKGVMVRHGGLANLVRGQRSPFAVHGGSRVLFFASPSFDASVSEVFVTLCAGAELHLPPAGGTPAGEALARLLARRRITLVTLPPSVLASLPGEGRDGGSLASLETLVTAGEALTADLVAAWSRRVERLVNAYGPTEATVCTTLGPPLDGHGAGTPTIGRPLAGVRVLVLDGTGRPVPVGVAGELCAGGVAPARGYRGRPGLTAERFVPDPGGPAGSRLYRTGDLARWLPAGTLEYRGRIDDQVKVRGFRVEPGEVEAALRDVPGVSQAVVVAVGGARAEELVAFVTWRGAPGDPAELRSRLRSRVPEHLVPGRYLAVESLPVTPAGKVDRRALASRAGEAGRERAAGGGTPPRTPLEAVVARLWEDELGVAPVGIDVDFFDLGGHSLRAIRLAGRLSRALDLEVPPETLLLTPTVAGVAAAVEARRRKGVPALPPIRPHGRGGDAPLSFAQRRLWLLERLEPGTGLYTVPAALELAGPLRLPTLAAALATVERRHEALRTRFAEVGGEPVQRVEPPAPRPPGVVDLSGLAPAARREAARRLARDDARRPFDLSGGAPYRRHLVRLGPEEHVLLLAMHHLVTDGWSLGVLFRELEAVYGARLRGEVAELPALPVQYTDYALWQREHVRGEVLEGRLAYWRERLRGLPPLLELPADRPRPATPGREGAVHRFALPAAALERLRALGREEGATAFMALLALVQAWLGWESGQREVVVGSPAAGRGRPELAGLLGFFVDNLVLRADLAGEPSLRALLRQARSRTLEAFAHQEVPFDTLVAELQPERSRSQTPLFQAVFTLVDEGFGRLDLPGLRARPLAVASGTTKFDLTLALREGGEATVVYRTDLFDPTTVQRMARHLRGLLEAAAGSPDRPLAALATLPRAERHAVLVEANDTAGAPEPAADWAPVHHLVAAAAARAPDRVAVVDGATTWSYGHLAARARGLARTLRAPPRVGGLPPEARVGLLLERSPELLGAMLGALEAGACYVPLDPAHPPERREQVARDAGLAAIVTRQELAAGPADDGSPPLPADPEALAYVLYTSGSTGTPKGVMIPHRGLANLCRWHRRAFAVGPDDRASQTAPAGFDASAWEIWPYLSAGATVELAPDPVQTPPGDLRRWLVARRVTIAFLATPLAEALLDGGWEAPGAPRPALRTLLTGGDALRRAPASPLPFELVNDYGPTECSVVATSGRVTTGSKGPPPIGEPIDGIRTHVLDGHLRPLPGGTPGELHLAGAGLARGYRGRAGETARRFVPDPFGPPGSRLYRTGDRVRRRIARQIEFLGRLDDQVKVRGFRIEPGEVEAALARHPSVRECAVFAAEGPGGEPRLVAYAAPAEGGAAGEAALRAFLRERLPDYLVPAWIERIERLPWTSRGKVDRERLRADHRERAREAPAAEAPRTELERRVAAVWREVLGVAQVGRSDDLFRLGGHSMAALRIAARLRDEVGVEVPVQAVFEAGTVAGLARRLEARRAEAAGLPPVVPRTPRRTAPELLPTSFGQRRLWFLDRLEPGTALYNVPVALSLRGSLDRAALARALAALARRHESLRSRLAAGDGEPVQVVEPEAAQRPGVIDLSGLGEGPRDAAARRLVREAVRAPFGLARAPLWRTRLLGLAPDEHVLVLTLHHAVTDGWSVAVLLEELGGLYRAAVRGEPTGLPEPGLQYGDYALWQREHLRRERLEDELAYWRERLRDPPAPLELPADRRRGALPGRRGALHYFDLPAGLLDRVRDLGRREGASRFMVLLAAFQVWLARHTGRRDLVVGTPTAGRGRPELERVTGFFVENLVLRTDLGGDPTFRALLRRVRADTLAAFAHQHVPFDVLVEALQPERSASHTPLYQVVFAFQGDEPIRLHLPGVSVELLSTDTGVSLHDLHVTLVDAAAGARGRMLYAADLFDPETVERMGARLRTLLEGAAADPDRPLSALPLLPAAEARQVLVEWNRTPPAHAPDTGVAERVAAQAARTPDAVAVVAGERVLTYAGLLGRARRLARRLRCRGVGPDDRVGLLLPRGPEILVSILGVLEAGGAYVPLDPAYPPDRLRFMIEDAGLRVLVTTAEHEAAAPGEVRRLVLDPESGTIRGESAPESAGERVDSLPPLAAPAHLAYVIYTSGSTGRPKGVMVTRGDLGARAADLARAFRLGPEDRQTQLVSPSFDVLGEEVFCPWIAGGAVVPLPELPAPARLLAHCARARLTKINLPASYWHELVDEVAAGAATLPASLRIVVAGAEAPSLEKLLLWERATGPDLCTFNAYGPTEVTIMTTLHEIPRPEEGRRPLERIPLGGPNPGTTCLVLDADGVPAPVGVPGELRAGGAGVSRGYLGRPGLTAERFVPDPFAPCPGHRAYRTGDRVRWLASGHLEFLGRLDRQVKLRGFRIEPDEITAVLERHPRVGQAALVVHRPEGGADRLLGYVVPREPGDGGDLGPALRAFLGEHLPDYMVPTELTLLERLPLTPNGKVDRDRLPLPGPRVGSDAVTTPPRNETEALLAQVWREVLDVERVGVHDDFFTLGGSSLALLRIHARLEDRLAHRIPMADLFRHSTVAATARHLDAKTGETPLAGTDADAGRDRGAARRAARRRRRGGR